MLHQSVLLEATLHYLDPKKGESYLDLTAGMGGHARAVLSRTQNYAGAVLVDRDQFAIDQLADLRAQGVTLYHQDFAGAVEHLIEKQRQFDLVLLDLGVSSPQLDCGERGFSFSKPARLDMRMDQTQKLSAYQVVNQYKEAELVRIFVNFADESVHKAQKLAKAIKMARPIETTTELAEVIRQKLHYKHSKVHPATKYFQALRIEVNDELGQLERTLAKITRLLSDGGRVAVISFHSLEDRLVKNYFKQQSKLGLLSELELVTPKPILGSVEDASNPRSRSAVLRVAMKNKHKKGGYNAKTN